MSYSMCHRINGELYQCQVDPEKLQAIFGYQPQIDISTKVGAMVFNKEGIVIEKGTFLHVNGYTISPGNFSKKVNSNDMKGDGLIEGSWDDVGKKLANLYFSNHADGSIIYVNKERHRLVKKEGSIEFIKV